MTDLHRILKAGETLTLSGVANGFLPLFLADLARACAMRDKAARAVYVAPDELAMRAIADTATYFAPELEVIQFPAWDCLPYDRASPSLRSSSDRLAALNILQRNRLARNSSSPPSMPSPSAR